MLKGSQTRYILLTASNHNKGSDIQTKSFLMEGQSRYFRVDFSLLVCGQSPPIPCCEFLEHGGAVIGQVPTASGAGRWSRMEEQLLSHSPTFSWRFNLWDPQLPGRW